MMLPILANVEWPSAVVGCVLIFCLTAGFIAAVMHYNIDGAMKLAGYFTGFLGLILGTILTYFFTREQVQQQVSEKKSIETAFQASQKQRTAAGQQLFQLATKIKRHDPSLEPWQAALFLESIGNELILPAHALLKDSPTPSPSACDAV